MKLRRITAHSYWFNLMVIACYEERISLRMNMLRGVGF